jgi:hypothetical protein
VEFGRYRSVEEERAPGEIERHHAFHITTGKRVHVRLIGEHGIGDQITVALALAGKTLPYVQPVLEVGPRPNGAFVVYPDDGSIDLPALLVRATDAASLPAIAAWVAIAVLRGLESLHRNALVHGALSPSCIRVMHDGGVLVSEAGRRSSTGQL